MKKQNPLTTIGLDILLITLGTFVFAIGVQAILIHQKFIIGGLYGTCLFLYYKTNLLSPGQWFFLLNIPLLIVGWIYLSRRFFYYSVYGVATLTMFTEILQLNFPIENQLYAAVAGGVICGIGSGIVLRSRGSGGGLDIIAIILNQKFNFGVGKFFMIYNTILFLVVLSQYKPDLVIASIILTFISTISLEQVLSLFNQRKIVYILSDNYREITDMITRDLHIGATLLDAKGAYSGKKKQMVMTITNNLQLKRLENRVFNIDQKALFIVENSFNVIGADLGRRKMY
ncbi:MAG: YitT family protein [Desulfocapsaceae bacterium]|nr:YitT family protein [Desulfocapsaceae bacterium]